MIGKIVLKGLQKSKNCSLAQDKLNPVLTVVKIFIVLAFFRLFRIISLHHKEAGLRPG
jgi:hypothetical protein